MITIKIIAIILGTLILFLFTMLLLKASAEADEMVEKLENKGKNL